MSDPRPIGVFDSGVGGLTVFRELSRLLPHENLLYLGDSARLPYGNKSADTIIRFTHECADFLLKKKIKLLLIACHTASAVALEELRKSFPIPVIGVVQAGFELVVECSKNQKIAILGTPGTILSGIYQKLLQEKLPSAQIFPIACPLFVPLAEEEFFDHAATDAIAQHYLAFLQKTQIDTALLACTHYPLLKAPIQKVLGPSVKILEPASRCVNQVVQQLSKTGELNCSTTAPFYQFFITDNPSRFASLSKTFLGRPLDPIFVKCLSPQSNS